MNAEKDRATMLIDPEFDSSYVVLGNDDFYRNIEDDCRKLDNMANDEKTGAFENIERDLAELEKRMDPDVICAFTEAKEAADKQFSELEDAKAREEAEKDMARLDKALDEFQQSVETLNEKRREMETDHPHLSSWREQNNALRELGYL